MQHFKPCLKVMQDKVYLFIFFINRVERVCWFKLGNLCVLLVGFAFAFLFIYWWFLNFPEIKRQHIVSRSFVEVEDRFMANATCELMWLLSLFRDLHVSRPKPALLFCNNQATLYIVANPIFHRHTKAHWDWLSLG